MPPEPLELPDFDLDDETLRRAGSMKWVYPPAGVLPAWIAELDVAPCPALAAALHEAVDRGVFGYPTLDRDSGLPEATASFYGDRFGWTIDPATVLATSDVMAGIMVALENLCEPGGVVVPTPAYPPFLASVPYCRRELITVPMLVSDGLFRLDLTRIEAELAAGARTVLLANPHNPTGRVFTRSELEELRDVVVRHGARVISDEIHCPVVASGHTPYATLEGTAEHSTTVVAASKAWNLPGLKCAQIICSSLAETRRLYGLNRVAQHGVSSLGVVASVAAYAEGRPWLDGMVTALQQRRDQLTDLLATHLPAVHCIPSQATYLAWLDVRELGLDDPTAVALERGRVMVQDGPLFGPGYEGFVRLNFGTSAERLERIVAGLASAWS